MKRIRPSARATWLPIENVVRSSELSMFKPTLLEGSTGATFLSSCLGCEDEPCAQFRRDEVEQRSEFEAPFSLDTAVCPVDALGRDKTGLMAIDDTTCVGCGLCVVRCPVGAIHLNPGTFVAAIEGATGPNYAEYVGDLSAFKSRRDMIDALMPREGPPFDDAIRVCDQIALLNSKLSGNRRQHAFRRLVRNSLLLCGVSARLKNTGDNNSACELVVEVGGRVYATELEPGVDHVDGLRRALSGVAILISRYGVMKSRVAAALVVAHFPNVRVDYFNVVDDVQKRLGVRVATIPLVLLLLAARARGSHFEAAIRSAESNTSRDLTPVVTDIYGYVGDGASAGLRSEK